MEEARVNHLTVSSTPVKQDHGKYTTNILIQSQFSDTWGAIP